jgi:hypothetical protein
MTTRELGIADLLQPRSRVDVALFVRGLIVPFVYTRLILVLAGFFAIYRIPQARAIGWDLPTSSSALNMWSHFDGRWYLTIARDGYSFTPGEMSGVAFAPLYPMLMRLGGRLAGGSDEAYLIAGLVIGNLSLIVALGYMMAILLMEGYDRAVASRAVWYVLIFPTSFFLSAVYPMSLFMALAAAAFYHARRGQWNIAGPLAGFAALSRPDGVLLTAGLAIEYLQQNRFRLRASALSLICGPAGLLVWMGFQWHQFGSPLTFIAAQKAWNYCTLETVLKSGRAPLQLGPTALLGLMTILSVREFRPCYWSFTAAMLLVMLNAARFWSITRFILVLFPAFMMLAIVGRRWRIVHILYTLISGPLSAVLMMRFSLNLWVA